MKLFILMLTLSLAMAAAADTVQKWTDSNGIVHYGDFFSAKNAENPESLKINDTFDQQSYDAGMQRHKENRELSDKLEKEQIAEEKKREADKEPAVRPPNSRQTRK